MTYAEITMFPIPFFEIKYLKEYKENVILIPTERKIKDKEEIEKIPCLFKKNKNSKNILIIFHCNGTDIFEIFKAIHNFSEQYNINILIPEYPFYSMYKYHIPSSKTILDNSIIVYDYVLKNMKNITEKNIYVLGRSLGTGPAVYLSSKRNPASTILISPFTTFAAVGKPDEEDKKFLLTQFRSIDYIDKINNPLLIVHGKIDSIINYNEAIQLFEKAGKNIIKEIKLVDKMPHNLFLSELKSYVIPLIIEFVDKHCPLNNNSNNVDIDFDKAIFLTNEEYKKTIFNYCGKEEI